MNKKISSDFIKITKARQHNLKNISLQIPKNKFVTITGLSGSGKSSLAFDTIYVKDKEDMLKVSRHMQTVFKYDGKT